MCGYGCRCVYKWTRNLYTDTWTLDSRTEGNLYSLFYAFLPFSNSVQGHYYFFKTEEKYGGYFFFFKEINPRCDVIYPLAQDRNSFLYHLQQVITCLYLNCFVDKELMDLAVQGWLGLRKQGKVTLRLFWCGSAQLTGQGNSQGCWGSSSGMLRASVGSLMGYQGGEGPSTPQVFCVSFISQPVIKWFAQETVF